jgi:hypothetical protein
MTPTAFHARLHAGLDERRDPLADPAIVAFLAEHPAALDAYARLQERCIALPASAPRPAPLRRPLPWLAAAATIAAIVAVAAVLASAGPHVGAGATNRSAAPTAARATGRVLAASLDAITPSLQAATPVSVRGVLLDAPGAHLEVFTTWSVP